MPYGEFNLYSASADYLCSVFVLAVRNQKVSNITKVHLTDTYTTISRLSVCSLLPPESLGRVRDLQLRFDAVCEEECVCKRSYLCGRSHRRHCACHITGVCEIQADKTTSKGEARGTSQSIINRSVCESHFNAVDTYICSRPNSETFPFTSANIQSSSSTSCGCTILISSPV